MKTLNNKKILIVEDQYITYDGLVNFFEAKGMLVIKKLDGKPVDTYRDAIKLADNFSPDVAIVDVELIGSKSGIDVCEYLRKHHSTFIILLTDKSEINLNMVKTLADGYILKQEKARDNAQLWISLQLHYPFPPDLADKTTGHSFRLRSTEDSGESFNEFIFWDKISWVESLNSSTGKGNNNIRLHMANPERKLICRGTLSGAMSHFPDQFIRINRSQIINKKHISRQKGRRTCYIGEKMFSVSYGYTELPDFVPR